MDSQDGRYGKISLLKQGTDVVVTAFGIDVEQLTFGRDPQCSVRLYYPDVSLVHCKIVFEERKAFLTVLGLNGMSVDGCKVFPSPSTASPTTIPLGNNSQFEIHGKRFRFSYPPKEIRALLFETPPRSNRRALRLSMINSAQVFSPRPSTDPQENLRVLQSPIKPFAPSQLSKVLPEQEEITLVQGSNPRVVEEDRDLVILEDVEITEPPPIPPQTPTRHARPSLHKLVLLRSAQRAVIQAEVDKQDQEEELEVFGTVLADDDTGSESDDDMDEAVSPTAETTGSETIESSQEPLWRKSLGRIWPFTGPQGPLVKKEDVNDATDSIPSSSSGESTFNTPTKQPESLALPFRTPQVRGPGLKLAPGRMSLAGGEAKRQVIQQLWRVKDIVVPPPTPVKAESLLDTSPSRAPRKTTIAEEERKAIQERRRSALRITEPLFPGGAPGLSPKKAKASPPFELLESQEAVSESLEDENLDAQGLLEKMRQTVEGIHRQSPVKPKPGIFTRSNSQQKPIPFSPFTAVTPASEKSASKTPGDDTPLADDEASPQGMENSLNEVSEESEDESLTTRRPRRVLRGNPDQKLGGNEKPKGSEAPKRTARRIVPPRNTSTAAVVDADATTTPQEEMKRSTTRRGRSKTPAIGPPVPSEKEDSTDEIGQGKSKRSTRAASKVISTKSDDLPIGARKKKPLKDTFDEDVPSVTDKENTATRVPKITRAKKVTTVKEEVLTEPELRPRRTTRARTRTHG